MLWQTGPVPDNTPLEKGGAIVALRLSPDELAFLLREYPTAVEAIHDLIAKAAEAEA